MIFDYNSTRPKLILAEYGRNVQNMVDYICSLPDREERNRLAQVVIDMMGVLNPHLRDVSDFKHKLWDHLYIISDFKIDVDSPYPIPTKENIHHKPEPLKYPNHNIRFKHYGYTVEEMIGKAMSTQNEEARQKMALSIANFMKMAYLTWNKDAVSDDQILNDLRVLSSGALTLPADTVLTKLDFKTPPPGSRTKPATGSGSNQQQNKKQNNSNFRDQKGAGGRKPSNSNYGGGHGGHSNYNNKMKKK
ncbi:DUF4290 domain-containing protein [Sphingobacterium lactis]|uniref:DUF4290 domain-containing protein n=1 Tax=Sphingobacterium lactis TaxID=797291 RepID=A0A1H6B5F1_9SPHI|nr:DUF4290 domain-containing protein [Sphingobacterium lactis]SEG56069.1 protein of unknown function [Sphingobacterium lactis]